MQGLGHLLRATCPSWMCWTWRLSRASACGRAALLFLKTLAACLMTSMISPSRETRDQPWSLNSQKAHVCLLGLPSCAATPATAICVLGFITDRLISATHLHVPNPRTACTTQRRCKKRANACCWLLPLFEERSLTLCACILADRTIVRLTSALCGSYTAVVCSKCVGAITLVVLCCSTPLNI